MQTPKDGANFVKDGRSPLSRHAVHVFMEADAFTTVASDACEHAARATPRSTFRHRRMTHHGHHHQVIKATAQNRQGMIAWMTTMMRITMRTMMGTMAAATDNLADVGVIFDDGEHRRTMM